MWRLLYLTFPVLDIAVKIVFTVWQQKTASSNILIFCCVVLFNGLYFITHVCIKYITIHLLSCISITEHFILGIIYPKWTWIIRSSVCLSFANFLQGAIFIFVIHVAFQGKYSWLWKLCVSLSLLWSSRFGEKEIWEYSRVKEYLQEWRSQVFKFLFFCMKREWQGTVQLVCLCLYLSLFYVLLIFTHIFIDFLNIST